VSAQNKLNGTQKKKKKRKNRSAPILFYFHQVDISVVLLNAVIAFLSSDSGVRT
jgi:hypothetical protein